MTRIDVEIEDAAWTAALDDAEALTREAALAASTSTESGAITILLTDSQAVREMNARFRGIDRETNVLAFPSAANREGHLGDVALAFGVCAGEAVAQAKPLAHHLRHLVVHGVLHLLGHDHQEGGAAERMEALERRLLAAWDIPDPYEQASDVQIQG